MKVVSIHYAKQHFSHLLTLLLKTKVEVIITRAGRPVARLLPIEDIKKSKIKYGFLKGKVKISKDFDAPLIL